jgi:hypothetical protein
VPQEHKSKRSVFAEGGDRRRRLLFPPKQHPAVFLYVCLAIHDRSSGALVLLNNSCFRCCGEQLFGVCIFGLTSEIAFRRICFALIAGAIALSVPVLDNFTR